MELDCKIPKMRKQRKHTILTFVFLGFIFWTSGTSMIYRFKNPSKTQTEVFLHIPKSFILNFYD